MKRVLSFKPGGGSGVLVYITTSTAAGGAGASGEAIVYEYK